MTPLILVCLSVWHDKEINTLNKASKMVLYAQYIVVNATS